MNHLYRVALGIRVTARWILASATFWLAANVGWLLIMHGDEDSMRLAKICGVLAVLTSATWQWLFSMEQRHEMILAKHQARIQTAPARRNPVPPAIQPDAARSNIQMVPQAV